MAVEARSEFKITGKIRSAKTITDVIETININKFTNWADGNGTDQFQLAFTDTRTLANGASETLDLTNLTDSFGNNVSFFSVKLILIHNPVTNDNTLDVGGGPNAFSTLWGDVSDIIKIRPGGSFMISAPDVTGYVVTATTADLLKIENKGTVSVDYEIIIFGIS